MFHKAERKKAKLRLWLNGMSESGKTYSALKLAKGMGGKVALIDTEAGRGNYYADEFDYDVCEIAKPFTPEKVINVMKEAEAAGYDIIVIDSTTHVWQEVLEIKSGIDEKGGNSYTNWNQPTKRYNAFLDKINQSPCHVILTSRVKRAHVLETDDKGKSKPKYVGLAPILRDGAEYDLTVEFSIDKEHRATPVKDNTRLFSHLDAEGVKVACDPFVITEQTGRDIMGWLNTGKEAKPDCVRCAKSGLVVESVDERAGNTLCAKCVEAYEEYLKKQAAKPDETK